MALSELESGYIGSPEKWRNFFKKMAYSDEIANCFLRRIKFEQENDYKLSMELSADEFSKCISVSSETSYELNYCSKSCNDFIMADGYNLIKYIEFNSVSILELDKPCSIKSSTVHNRKFFKELISENISDQLYYSYNNWTNCLRKYNGANNEKFMAQDYNMMLGELGFGFPKSKTKIYSNALVIGLDGNYASALLLPDEKTKDGEMEAWLFDAEDIYRFRSFAEMIIWNLIADFDYRGSELIAFLKRVGVDEILDLDVLASNAYVSKP